MPYIGRELDRGNYLKLDDISSSFNSSTTTFNLTNGGKAFYPGSAFSILVVLAGVVQEPEAAYQINQTQITFASAPLAGDQFFCIVLGQALGVNTPASGSVNGAQLAKPFNYDNYFYLDDANNRVGVGTATPMTPLHVEGTGRFTNVTVTGDLTVEGTTSTLDTVVTEVDKLEVGANNNTVGVAITQSGSGDAAYFMGGDVGIGTNNPQGKLHISDTNHPLVIDDNSTNVDQGIVFTSGGSSAYSAAIRLTPSGAANQKGLRFHTGGYINSVERLRIHSSGKFSFGTITASAAKYTFNSGGTNEVARFESTDAGAYLAIKDSSSTSINFVEGGGDVLSLGVNSVERLRITTSGVGIGTDDPQSLLEVFGTSPIIRSKHSTSQKYTQINHNGTDGYVDWSSGHLVFRGASNTERLRIRSDGKLMTQSAGYVYTASSSGSLSLYGGNTNLGGGIVLGGGNDNADIRFLAQESTSSPAERMRITKDGDVGIGVGDPDVYSLGGTNRYAAIKATAGYAVLNLVDSNNSGSYLQFGNPTVRRGSLHFDSNSNFLVTINESGSGTSLAEKLRLDLYGRLTISGQGLKLNPTASSLYTLDGSLSYYGTTNGVYLNGAGTGGWLRLNASGTENNQNNIDIFGGSAGNYINMRTNNADRLRIDSSGNVTLGYAGNSLYFQNGFNNRASRIQNGGASGSADLKFYTNNAGTELERLRISNTGQIGMGKAGAVTVNGNSPLTIQESDSNSETICLRATNSGGNGSQPGIVMKTAAGGHIGGIYCDVNSDYMRISTSGTDRIYITNDGKVGVGAASPLNTLHVYGANTIARFQSSTSYVDLMFQNTGATNGFIQYNNSGNFNFYANSGSTPTLTITAGAPGNVIVGSTTAQAHANMDDLQVGGGSGNRGITISSGTSNFGTVAFGDSADGSGTDRYEGFIEYYHNDNSMRLGTVHQERVRITSDGSIGVGAYTPVTDVDISQKTGAVALPQGTTAQRPSGSAPYIRKNTTNNALEFYNGTEWVEIITDYFPTGSTILG